MSNLKDWPKDSVAIIAGRVDDPYRKDVPGSQEVDCFNCGQKCMVSPATMDRACRITNSTIVCVQCTRAYYDESGQKIQVLPPTEEQKKERLGK